VWSSDSPNIFNAAVRGIIDSNALTIIHAPSAGLQARRLDFRAFFSEFEVLSTEVKAQGSNLEA
jgi:hypothetical protein